MNDQLTKRFDKLDEEQLPIANNQLHGGKHFAGLYAGEHVAATEFVIGATFVVLGASTRDILFGLLIGNILAVLSWTFLTAPIAVQTRLSLYTYLNKIAGSTMTKLYNWANVIIFTVISAAMITVSSSAVRFFFNIPAQLDWYSTNLWFILIVVGVGIVVVLVAIYGFNTVADFSSICAPWLFALFVAGALALLPALSHSVLGTTTISSWKEFLQIGDQSIWKGVPNTGDAGIGLWEVIGFAWAANTITHVGLIDMAILRYAKKASYGLYSSFGMLFGHYIAWIAAGIMGAGAGVLLGQPVVELDPGDVAYYALGASGFVIVIVAGWTTANANLYRAGLAAQAIFYHHSRRRTTLVVGIFTVIIACFPFVFTKMLPMLTYAGLIVVPVGAIVFAEHFIFPKIGLTRYWGYYKKLVTSRPAVFSWGAGLVLGFGLNALQIMSFYYLFIPTWIFTLILYTFLARRYGAAEDYTHEKAEEVQLQADIVAYQEEKAKRKVPRQKDTSMFSRLLAYASVACLLVILALSVNVMLASPDMEIYNVNKAMFHQYGFYCTIGYFVFAYWNLQRKKTLNKAI
ncbi:purine-cytosine permease family protein [Thermophagus sp. OGC60D27]|uniref:purine-cytosine permease family protein n=1 Tax=Thermophagus sp. OGC60D27 TaxID=3458415 RepID=UPI0040380762